MRIFRSTQMPLLIALSIIGYPALAADIGAAPQISLLSEVQKAVGILAVLGGAAWAYFRFIRFRTLKKRVEFNFDWATSIVKDGRTVGVLTVKLTNKGNTQIELRKDQHYRCPLTSSLIQARPQTEALIPVTLYPADLSPLGFIFKAHKRIEPGETIDDVAVLSIDTSSSIAIQFCAAVLTLNGHGGREQIASSMIAFPLGLVPDKATACSDDEQDVYDETKEIREILRGWIGETRNFIGSGKIIPELNELATLKLQAEAFVIQLVGTQPQNVLTEARKCADRISMILGPQVRE